MIRIALSLAFIVLLVAPSLAQTPPTAAPTRVRGTVEKLDGQTLAIKTREGPVTTIAPAPNFIVNGVVKKELSDIKEGDYVGVASLKGTDGKLHALEVLIFPEAMRGTGEGHSPWDLQPESLMTNAAVAGVAAAPTGRTLKLAHNSPLTKSSYPEKDTSYGMTNEEWHTACGTVDRANRLRQRAVRPSCTSRRRSRRCR